MSILDNKEENKTKLKVELINKGMMLCDINTSMKIIDYIL